MNICLWRCFLVFLACLVHGWLEPEGKIRCYGGCCQRRFRFSFLYSGSRSRIMKFKGILENALPAVASMHGNDSRALSVVRHINSRVRVLYSFIAP